MCTFWRIICVVGLTVTVFSSSAHSTIITFTDRDAWTAAVGGGIATIDFNGMAQGDAWWLSSSTTIGTTTFSSDGGDLWAITPTYPGLATYYSSDYLLWNPLLDENDNIVGLTLTTNFGSQIRAAGWDFGALDGSIANFVFGIGGTSFTTTSAQDTYSFFGVISDTSFSEVTMISSGLSMDNQGPMGTLDNLSYAPVPEPSTVILLSLGIVGVAIARRKRT